MAERSLQELLITNFALGPSGYTGSQGNNGTNGYAGSAGPAGSNGAGFSGPRITSIGYPDNDTAANILGGDTITLTGANFASGAQVIINGNAASVVSVVNSTTITFTAPPNPTGSYILYVLNTDGATTIAVPGLQYSGTPAWTTPAGTLGTTAKQVSFTSNLVATGDAPVTYSVYSGALPTGLTLAANTGQISGTTPNVSSDTTYNFTIRATDAQQQDTNRAFSLTVQPALYDFTSFTFTNTSSTSQTAPSRSTLLSSYNTSTNTWLNNTAYFDVTAAGFQLWTVPVAGTYRIQCAGASGGTSAGGASGGYGAIVTADITLLAGDKYRILVGHKPAQSPVGSNYSSGGGGGGGASAFWKDSAPITPVIVAGAGGGASGNWGGYGYANQPGQNAQAVGAAGGLGLGPGPKGTAATGGNGAGPNGTGAGHGAGWLTAGDGYTGNGSGNGARLYDTATGGAAGDNAGSGGWGGGGGARNICGGGAGGYNGGSVPDNAGNAQTGGGGASYVGNGATLVSDVQTNTGHGSIVITKL